MKGNILDNKHFKENPFRVPEGYFQQMQQEVMAQLPEQRPAMKVQTKRPRLFLHSAIAAAASVCIAIFGAMIYKSHLNQETKINASHVKVVHASYDDDSDYIMMDNADIYNYIAEL